MATEKIPIKLLSTLTSSPESLPGGITFYDSKGTPTKLLKPIQLSELESKGIQSVSKEELEDQGIRIVSGSQIQFVYPKTMESLVSFVGILPNHTLVFTNPSEDPRKHRYELSSEVFQTIGDISFDQSEPSLISVRKLSDSTLLSISRLGHFVSRIHTTQMTPLFPPSDLRLYLPPVHIPSQHLGDCAADTIQTALFFADGFRDEFAELANRIYKQYIRTEPQLLFAVDNPTIVAEVKKAYSLGNSFDQQREDILAVFATMIRRFILVRLLDFGSEEEIETLKIPVTTCLLPKAVGPMGKVYRRKSINVLAGSLIARKLSRVFNPNSMLSSDLKLKETEINYTIEHKFFCLLFNVVGKSNGMHSLLWNISNPVPFDTSTIRAILIGIFLTKKNGQKSLKEAGGHSISLFQFQENWYLQDDNIGIAKQLTQFKLDDFLSKKSKFFMTSYQQLQNKSDLIEQGFFTEDELKAGAANNYTFYGYRYLVQNFFKEIIVHKENLEYGARYDNNGSYIYLCYGDLTKNDKKLARLSCTEDTVPVPVDVSLSKNSQLKKVTPLPPGLINQLTMPSLVSPVREKKINVATRRVRANIQANLNSFKSQPLPKSTNVTRKIKPYTNPTILNQFTAF